MKRMSLLLLFVLIVSNLSARNKIVSVTVEYRYLAYDFMSCFAEYDLHDNQLVLKEQPDYAPLKFDEVIDCAKLDSIVRDLVKHKGKEIKKELSTSNRKMIAKQKKILQSSFHSYLSSIHDFCCAITIIQNNGYMVLYPDYSNKGQYVLCYNGHYYSLPDSQCDSLIYLFHPIYLDWDEVKTQITQ